MLHHALSLIFAVRPKAVYAILRNRLATMVPLNTLLGIDITAVGDGTAEARLPMRKELTNHIGSMHATAIFGLAEAASGGAMSGAFAPVVTTIRPVAASASVEFIKIARDDLIAHAKTEDSPAALRRALAEEGKVAFDVLVDVQDAAGAEIARIRVGWHVRPK